MLNSYYKDTIESFNNKTTKEIIGSIILQNQFDSLRTQNKSWETQIPILKSALNGYKGTIFFEFSIPRMGKRVDVILIIEGVVFVIEFKVGESKYLGYQIEQVWDYALDLKNFHETSHLAVMVPILICTEAIESFIQVEATSHDDKLLLPIKANKEGLGSAIKCALDYYDRQENDLLQGKKFEDGAYSPTPTIIEAAISLYNSHTVEEITRSDASAKNLTLTTDAITKIVQGAKENKKKVICFVTGVPGAGKTLVGLKVATTHLDSQQGNNSVYLSGNGPLVSILQEALARDRVKKEVKIGLKVTKKVARQAVKSFIQNIHHYRDAYLVDDSAPYDHVAIFDEAQRAWDKEQTVKFMKQKKGQPNFTHSEPDFLISCLNRHEDWAVVICLVGGGQEINTGEAGISEWLNAIYENYTGWGVYISPHLLDSEYTATEAIERLKFRGSITFNADLHLAVSMRSFRAENLSLFVQYLLELDGENAKTVLAKIIDKYPVVLTRDLITAKYWLKEKARGSERFGMLASSQAIRLKPYAIDVKSPISPINWFLEGKDDVRSSFYLEDVATEFHIQGLELDWTCLMWDGDLRHSDFGWQTYSFKGKKWQNIKSQNRKKYLLNAYRVLLTRARQGMVIVVPDGSEEDHTRKSEYYDNTYSYLKGIGLRCL